MMRGLSANQDRVIHVEKLGGLQCAPAGGQKAVGLVGDDL
jgi:hypothetical protein